MTVTGRLLRNSPYPDLQNKALIAFPAAGKLDPKKLPPIAVLASRKGDAREGQEAHGRERQKQSAVSEVSHGPRHRRADRAGPVDDRQEGQPREPVRVDPVSEQGHRRPVRHLADRHGARARSLARADRRGNGRRGGPARRQGQGHAIAKKDVETRTKNPKSLMPEDLVVHLSEDDLIDLVEYLFTLKTAALAVDAWDIVGPFDNGSGFAGLDTVFPPEKGVDLKATYKGKDGKVGWRKVKPGRAATSICRRSTRRTATTSFRM